MHLRHVRLLGVAVLIAIAAVPQLASAQSYPDHAVRVIVPAARSRAAV